MGRELVGEGGWDRGLVENEVKRTPFIVCGRADTPSRLLALS